MGGKGTIVPPGPLPPNAFGDSVVHIFGRRVPEGVRSIETLACKTKAAIMVHWRTSSGPHSMEIENWNDDTLEALIVAMRFTCS
jgi:hypothetical protein